MAGVCAWCERGDSNPHPLRDQILNLARLPVPPLSRLPIIREVKGRASARGLHRLGAVTPSHGPCAGPTALRESRPGCRKWRSSELVGALELRPPSLFLQVGLPGLPIILGPSPAHADVIVVWHVDVNKVNSPALGCAAELEDQD